MSGGQSVEKRKIISTQGNYLGLGKSKRESISKETVGEARSVEQSGWMNTRYIILKIPKEEPGRAKGPRGG